MTPTIRLEIWVGDEYAAEGHEHLLSVDDLELLRPLIGDAVDDLINSYAFYAKD